MTAPAIGPAVTAGVIGPAGRTRELLATILGRGFPMAFVVDELGWSRTRVEQALSPSTRYISSGLAEDVARFANRLGVSLRPHGTQLERLEREVHRCPGCSRWVLPPHLMRVEHRCPW